MDQPTTNQTRVTIRETRDAVHIAITVHGEVETLTYISPGMLSGSDLRDVLDALGIPVDWNFEENQ